MSLRRTAGGLVVYENQVMLVRKESGALTLPKGAIDPGEDAWVTAAREVGEETGLRVTAHKYLGTIPRHSIHPDFIGVVKEIYMYRADWDGTFLEDWERPIGPDREVGEWVGVTTLREQPELMTYPEEYAFVATHVLEPYLV